jgi:hypothetical protein
MAIAKFLGAKVRDAVAKLLRASPEVSVVVNGHPRSAKELDRRNVISEIPGQAVQPVAFRHAESVSSKSRISEETGAGAGERAFVPGTIPSGMVAIHPGILSAQQHSSAKKSNYKATTLHLDPPIRH